VDILCGSVAVGLLPIRRTALKIQSSEEQMTCSWEIYQLSTDWKKAYTSV